MTFLNMRCPHGAHWFDSCAECGRAVDPVRSARREWLRHESTISVYLFERIRQWEDAGRPPAQTYFTASLERDVACMIEASLRSSRLATDSLIEDLAKVDPVVEFRQPGFTGCALCWETSPREGHTDDCPWARARAYAAADHTAALRIVKVDRIVRDLAAVDPFERVVVDPYDGDTEMLCIFCESPQMSAHETDCVYRRAVELNQANNKQGAG